VAAKKAKVRVVAIAPPIQQCFTMADYSTCQLIGMSYVRPTGAH